MVENSLSFIAVVLFADFFSGYADGSFEDKITILNKALKTLGYMGIDMNPDQTYGYRDAAINQAGKNRDDNLGNLDPKDYRCTVLPGGKFEPATECPKP